MKRQIQRVAGVVAIGTLVFAGCDQGNVTMDDPNVQPSASEQAAAPAGQVGEQAPAEAAVENAAAGEANTAIVDKAINPIAKIAVGNVPVAQPLDDAGAICSLSGAAGSMVDCPVKLARGVDGIAARALEGVLSYDAVKVSLAGFYGEVCSPDGQCVEKQVTDASPTVGMTGHVLKHQALDRAAATGQAKFMLIHLSAPQTAISEATAGQAEEIMIARFTLNENVSSLPVQLGSVKAADSAANAVSARIADGAIVTGGIVD